jgi:hypothetical protein
MDTMEKPWTHGHMLKIYATPNNRMKYPLNNLVTAYKKGETNIVTIKSLKYQNVNKSGAE